MSLSHEDSEKLKKVAKAALVPVIGVAVLKLSRQENRTRYVYYLEASGSYIVGLYNESLDKLTQIAGDVVSRVQPGETPSATDEFDVTLDDTDIPPGEIEQLSNEFGLNGNEN